MSTDYFKTTPLKKWPVDKVREYLSTNGLSSIDTKLVSCNGLQMQPMKLKVCRRTFGVPLGERIYLIIRERIEKEEDTLIKMGISPMMSPMMSPIGRLLQSPSYSPQSAPIDLVNSRLSDFKLDGIESPKAVPTSPKAVPTSPKAVPTSPKAVPTSPKAVPTSPKAIPMSSSASSADKPIKLFDFKETDERALQHLNKKRAELRASISHAEQSQTRQFLSENPPLLWHKQHLILFLTDLSIHVTNQLDSVDIDDFIMNSIDEFELIFRGKGRLIYDSIRSKFINPDIKKLPKPVPHVTMKTCY